MSPRAEAPFAEPGDRDARLVADAESERAADCDRQHRRQVADHGDQPEVLVGHVHVAVAPFRRPVRAAHVLGEDAPGLDAARHVDAHVAVERRADVLRTHRRGDADRRRLVAASGVERPRDLPLLVKGVAALLDRARDQHVAVRAEQVLTVETRLADLAERRDRLGCAGYRHGRGHSSESPSLADRLGRGRQALWSPTELVADSH